METQSALDLIEQRLAEERERLFAIAGVGDERHLPELDDDPGGIAVIAQPFAFERD